MDIPNFHDGHFDGLRIRRDKSIDLFLRSQDERSFTLTLEGVQAMRLFDVKVGNIILDVVLRSVQEVTSSDIRELYDLSEGSGQINELLVSTRQKALQILELNPSYGAQGLFLFGSFKITEMARRTAMATT